MAGNNKKSTQNCSTGSCSYSTLDQKYVNQLVCAIKNISGIQPPPEEYSGVIINGVTYPVVMLSDGTMMYVDEGGLKCIPCGAEFTNIIVKDFIEVSSCYQTLTGKVYIEGREAINSQIESLWTKYEVKESTDTENPVGSSLSEIPEEWIKIDCLCNC